MNFSERAAITAALIRLTQATWSRLKIYRIIAHHHQKNTIGGMVLRGSPAILMTSNAALERLAHATTNKAHRQVRTKRVFGAA